MSSSRFHAINTALNRPKIQINIPAKNITEAYGENVFDDKAMRKYLPSNAYKSVKEAINANSKISREVADQVAASMKAWAIEKGATHHTHWFQPLTGMTAEKHDAFFTLSGSGEAIETFKADVLVQQEPDASSFPNGGLRSTFEARGYTAWDPSSPAFIMEIGEGKTLCIPTIFVAYTGEALDYKAPLLKSQQLLESAAVAVCQYFDRNITKVTPTLGWEQEYFLIDEALFNARPDLLYTGRTLIGKNTPKGQQLSDHYFGSIPERIYAYMVDLERECHKLGIPVSTRHNEVAPGQYELAPIFEEVNVAIDHNQLLMDLMDRIARRHSLSLLLHEKPFAEVNGSGKHNNWSMATNTGKNLLSPGKTPRKNLQFLTFFINTIAAVHQYDDLLRASVASASNDHRLGGHEAPPAIISVFIGSQLDALLNDLGSRGGEWFKDEDLKQELKLDIHNRIPDLLLDNTDRNRTSPFAFTGNKFEIRMAGSSVNCASPMIVMNTIVAEQLKQFKIAVDKLIKGEKMKRDTAILTVLQQLIKSSKSIRFEGDNYSDAWKKEAEKRGLSNIPNTPEALDAYVSKEATKLFVDNDIMSATEIQARHEIMLENYTLKLQIESRTLGELIMGHVLPPAITYQTKLVNNIQGMKAIGLKKSTFKAQLDIVERIGEHINALQELTEEMTKTRRAVNEIEDARNKAIDYNKKVKPLMATIRKHADRLEFLVEDELWALPKYKELMFVK